jgi:hypothetical protein
MKLDEKKRWEYTKIPSYVRSAVWLFPILGIYFMVINVC